MGNAAKIKRVLIVVLVFNWLVAILKVAFGYAIKRVDDVYIDRHVLVRPDLHISKADKLSDTIEKEIKDNRYGVSDVIVHMEPKVTNRPDA